jgi:YHS domain-containing protein
VEGTTIKQRSKALSLKVNDRPVYVCCAGCAEKLKADPGQYLTKPVKDPVSGKSFKVTPATPTVERAGILYLFSGETTKTTFEQSPERYTH